MPVEGKLEEAVVHDIVIIHPHPAEEWWQVMAGGEAQPTICLQTGRRQTHTVLHQAWAAGHMTRTLGDQDAATPSSQPPPLPPPPTHRMSLMSGSLTPSTNFLRLMS